MSNEFKLVPVKPTDAMVRAGMGVGDDNCLYWKHPQQAYVDMLAAAPQPPALGGEPDTLAVVTLGCFSSEELGDIDIEPQMSVLERIQQELVRSDSDEHIELIDRAHLAPLQAEIERLKDNVREVTTYRDNAIKKIERLRNEFTGTEKERDQLKARCDGLETERVKALDFLLHVKKCLRRNGEYAPLIHQDLDELIGHRLSNDCQCSWCALSKPAGSERVCHLCRGEGRVGGPAPDEGGGKNCVLCDGTGMAVQP